MLNHLTALFHMTDAVWARHANPWSVWTRYGCLPLLAIALWSRVWIGAWAWVPVLAILGWIWINPRCFPPPRSTRHWASKAVLGERVWLNRHQIPIPRHHLPVIAVTNGVNGGGFMLCVWGLVTLQIWPTVFGTTLVILGKTWFLDRMVWLYGDMCDRHPPYRAWLY